jgi:hypothetical protein
MRLAFTEKEWRLLLKRKKEYGVESWHDFVMLPRTPSEKEVIDDHGGE